MDTILTFLQLGVEHILDFEAYDHMLFIVSICLSSAHLSFKQLAIMATAFTIGHSISLILSVLDIVHFPSYFTELGISGSIVIFAAVNLLTRHKDLGNVTLKYLIILIFGLIHGMGFSSYLKQLFITDTDILGPLLGFNLGIEFAQIAVILLYLLIMYILSRLVSDKAQDTMVKLCNTVVLIMGIFLFSNVLFGL